MRVKFEKDLLFINSCSLVLILIITFLSDIQALRIILGLPFLLFSPGYALLAALFPYRNQLQSLTRISLSVGLSLAISTIIGVILNQVWEIELAAILTSFALFVAIMTFIAWYRRGKHQKNERFEFVFTSSLPRIPDSITGKILVGILIIAIFGSVISVVYALTNSKPGEQFTEFYILDIGGNAEEHPIELEEGEKGRVIAHIVNHEYQTLEYQLKVFVDDEQTADIGPIKLKDEQEWYDELLFMITESHASTTLSRGISEADATGTGVTIINVVSAESFNVGDCIRIARGYYLRSEISSIERIDGNVIHLSEALTQGHPKGENVVRVQKVEFILSKLLEFEGTSTIQTSFLVYPRGENLDVSITNTSQRKATYEIRIQSKSDDNIDQQLLCKSIEIDSGEQWHKIIDCVPIDYWAYDTEILLFKDNNLVCEGRLYEYFQTLRLWVTIAEN